MRRRRLACLLIALTVGAAGCEPSPETIDTTIRDRLVGTWLRDYEENGTRVRRVLVLEADGRFREMSHTLGPQEAGTRHAHEGVWVFDGTNLKRRYTLMDGKQPSAPTIPFAAFQVEFTSAREFVGTDNVRRRELRYQRVPDGTQP